MTTVKEYSSHVDPPPIYGNKERSHSSGRMKERQKSKSIVGQKWKDKLIMFDSKKWRLLFCTWYKLKTSNVIRTFTVLTRDYAMSEVKFYGPFCKPFVLQADG